MFFGIFHEDYNILKFHTNFVTPKKGKLMLPFNFHFFCENFNFFYFYDKFFATPPTCLQVRFIPLKLLHL